ncbi:RNA polymerase subunit sigma [Clostridium botulinum]|uniref:RNA polymerase subunit sigma n=1 Tax=Clostridium botulinum TaxID=1491 RepID=UPI00099B68B0|nr:RNA polymerase subunit sigma [Clostridium botulinum]OPD21406.1 RNA polymerase subunit sigma [Clostridium botulinum]
MLDKIRKQKIGDKEYSFRMVNKTIRKIDEKYGNYGDVIFGLMEGKQFYTNTLKLISLSCIEKEWDIEELEETMTAEQYQKITVLAVNIYLDYMGLNEETEEERAEKKEVKKEKN